MTLMGVILVLLALVIALGVVWKTVGPARRRRPSRDLVSSASYEKARRERRDALTRDTYFNNSGL